MDQAWAASLRALGYPASLPLSYDRLTDSPAHTLGELASSAPETQLHTFHFVLNNAMVDDHRIPPYGFSYDEAKARNTLPVPSTLFGNPGPGGTYNYWDERAFAIPGRAVSAEVRLYYQQTTWEYIQFLWKQNDGLSPFLGAEGRNLLDAWLHTGMATPLQIASVTVGGIVAMSPGEASSQSNAADHMTATRNADGLSVDLVYAPGCGSTGHSVYFGPLSATASYGYAGSACSSDTSGRLTFTPTVESVFFLVAANNGAKEGSYGTDSAGVLRPEASGPAFAPCDYPQELTGSCDSP